MHLVYTILCTIWGQKYTFVQDCCIEKDKHKLYHNFFTRSNSFETYTTLSPRTSFSKCNDCPKFMLPQNHLLLSTGYQQWHTKQS